MSADPLVQDAVRRLDALTDHEMSIKHGGGHGDKARLDVIRDIRIICDAVRVEQPSTPFGDGAA